MTAASILGGDSRPFVVFLLMGQPALQRVGAAIISVVQPETMPTNSISAATRPAVQRPNASAL